MTLFYVDDDQDDVEMFLDAIKSLGLNITCYTAQDSDDALLWLNACSILPDLIFLDINMPKLNGIEFLKELRRDPKYEFIPAVIYSTGAHTLSLLQQRQLGIIRIIQKQADFRKLCRQLNQLLGNVIATGPVMGRGNVH